MKDIYVGDLALFPRDGGHVVGVIDAVGDGPTWVAWGDCREPFPNACGAFLVASRSALLPGAGALIGRRFDSIGDFIDAIRPHMGPHASVVRAEVRP